MPDGRAFADALEFKQLLVADRDRFLEAYATGHLDRLDVAYTRFISVSRQEDVVETLLPLGSLGDEDDDAAVH